MHDFHLRKGEDGKGNYLKPYDPYLFSKHKQELFMQMLNEKGYQHATRLV
jgi:hypothetical protein